MMRDLILDFRRGGGSVPEVVHGIVRIWGTEVRPNGPSVVVTTETTLKLSGGKATLLNAQTSGTGPLYEWAYIIQVEPFHGRNFRFYTAIPDGTGPVNLVDLPKLNPYTGEGFYVDIEEWEALYGALPSRVDALETSQATQDGKITTLEARPIGNATMRVDTTVGTRIFITDGVTERMVSGDTGWRSLTGVASIPVLVRRYGDTVELQIESSIDPAAGAFVALVSLSNGYRPRGTKRLAYGEASGVPPSKLLISRSSGEIDLYGKSVGGVFASVSWSTTNAWPTTLPGTPA